MFRFEHPELFWAVLLPVLILVAYANRKYFTRKDWAKWGSDSSHQKVLSKGIVKQKWMWVSVLAAILITIASVNPQWGFRSVSVESRSAAIYMLMDISSSMLAEDIAPSRLERTRRFALELTTAFRTDKIGLILFAGNAYTQSPLTSDWHAVQLYLNAANPDQAGTQGTAIGDAVRLAIRPKQGAQTAEHGALIILTDGEDHDSDAPEAIEEAASAGWITFLVGVGTESGATIPMNVDGYKDVKRDASGQPVRTAMNRTLMKELARKGNGKYFDLTESSNIIENLRKELAGLERSQMEKRSFTEHKSYYQWFLLPALLMLFVLVAVNYQFDVI